MNLKDIKNSITVKIVCTMSLCIILFTFVGVLTASALYSFRLSERSRQISSQYLSVISNQTENGINELKKLSALCSSSTIVSHALTGKDPDSSSVKKSCLEAQTKLDNLASSSPLSNYIRRFVILNTHNIHVSFSGGTAWTSSEWQTLLTNMEKQEKTGDFPLYRWHSLLYPDTPNLSYMVPLSGTADSYLYIELSEAFLSDQLLPYTNLQKIFIASESSPNLLTSFSVSEDCDTALFLTPSGSRVRNGGAVYRIFSLPVSSFDLRIGCLNAAYLNGEDNLYMLYVLLILLLTTACAGIAVTRIVTKRITDPIHVLTKHIRKLSHTNTFTADPQIELSSDEIGEIGRTVNQLTSHIEELLKEQAAMYERQKNVELSLLQSQINPHFLYNTLDSIRWMAVIQGSKNIEQTTKALIHLLRNTAKGLGDKIPLRDELSLVADYVHIQQVRYVEIFDYLCTVPDELMDCLIVKFTLQPIVENAILHGIEPTGRFGQITINAHAEGDSLFLTVEDNGAGMTKEELEQLTASISAKPDPNSMNGIGVSNVDTRLKFQYGEGYGLTYESAPDQYTRVTIHIPREEALTDV